MAKLTLTPITSGFGTASALNSNFAAIEVALENTVSRDGTSPNTLTASLDANSQRIINLPDAVNPGDAVTLRQYDAAASPSATGAIASAAAALVSQNAAAISASTASADVLLTHADVVLTHADVVLSNSASAAATASAVLAQSWTSSGFGGTLLDLGFVTDATIVFPTDLGVLV